MGWLASILAKLAGPWLLPAVGIGAAALVSIVGVQSWRLHTAQAGEAKAIAALAIQSKAFSEEVALAEAAAASQSEANRAEEQRRTQAQKEIIDETIRNTEAVVADAAAARDSHDRLLERTRALIAAAGRPAAGDPQPARPGASAAGPGLLLADVLGRSDARSGQLAVYADQARTAGLACERSYDALKP